MELNGNASGMKLKQVEIESFVAGSRASEFDRKLVSYKILFMKLCQ